jgi:ribonuclease HI
VKGFRNARFKGFSDRSEAEKFIEESKIAEKRAKGEESSVSNKRRKVDNPLARKIAIHITFDGGSRGNPGVAGSGAEVIIRFLPFEEKGSIERKKIRIREFLGVNSTNNEAEYQGVVSGLIHGLNEVRDFTTLHSLTEDTCQVQLVVQGDSDLIIQQLNGTYNCNSPKLQPFNKKAKQILFDMKKIASVDVTFEHVYRKDNAVADGTSREVRCALRSRNFSLT